MVAPMCRITSDVPSESTVNTNTWWPSALGHWGDCSRALLSAGPSAYPAVPSPASVFTASPFSATVCTTLQGRAVTINSDVSARTVSVTLETDAPLPHVPLSVVSSENVFVSVSTRQIFVDPVMKYAMLSRTATPVAITFASPGCDHRENEPPVVEPTGGTTYSTISIVDTHDRPDIPTATPLVVTVICSGADVSQKNNGLFTGSGVYRLELNAKPVSSRDAPQLSM